MVVITVGAKRFRGLELPTSLDRIDAGQHVRITRRGLAHVPAILTPEPWYEAVAEALTTTGSIQLLSVSTATENEFSCALGAFHRASSSRQICLLEEREVMATAS